MDELPVARDERCLTTALTDITTAGVDHPAATGIDHMKAAAVICNGPITAVQLLLFV
jgi:hypothetical protein